MAKRGAIGSAIAALALIVSSCAGGGTTDRDQASSATPTAVARATATVAPTPTALGVAETSLPVPASIAVFGGVEFTVTRAVVSNEDPDSRIAGLGLITGERFLHLEIAAHNPAGFATLTIDDRDFLSMLTESGTEPTQVFSPDIVPRSIIGPGTTGTYLASFPIDDTFDPSTTALVFGGSDHVQVNLWLVPRPEPSPAFPSPVPIDLSGVVDGRVVCGETTLDVDDISAFAALDNPADIANTGGLGRRALAGHAFLHMTLDVTVAETEGGGGVADGGGCVGTIVSDELLTVAVAGALLEDRYVVGDPDVEARVGDSVTLTVGFMVPVEETLTVSVGRDGGRTVSTEAIVAG